MGGFLIRGWDEAVGWIEGFRHLLEGDEPFPFCLPRPPRQGKHRMSLPAYWNTAGGPVGNVASRIGVHDGLSGDCNFFRSKRKLTIICRAIHQVEAIQLVADV